MLYYNAVLGKLLSKGNEITAVVTFEKTVSLAIYFSYEKKKNKIPFS